MRLIFHSVIVNLEMKVICFATLLLVGLVECQSLFGYSYPCRPQGYGNYPVYGGYPPFIPSVGYQRRGYIYGRSNDVLIPVAATGSNGQQAQTQATSQAQPTVVQVVPSPTSVKYEQGPGYVSAAQIAEVPTQSINYQSSGQSNVVIPHLVGAQVVMVPSVPMPAQVYQPSSLMSGQSAYQIQQQTSQQQQAVSHVQQPTVVSVHEPKSLDQVQVTSHTAGHVVPSVDSQQVPIILPLGPSSPGSYVRPAFFSSPVNGNPVFQFISNPTAQHQESAGHHQVSQMVMPYSPGQAGLSGGYTSSSFYETVPTVQQKMSGELVASKSSKVDESVVVDGKRYRLHSITVVTQPRILLGVEPLD